MRVMAEDKKREPTVRDILRKGELPARPVPFLSATQFLFDRLFRRPAGNSARIWRRLEWDDPFEDRPLRSRKADYKGVYAKGRFVRMDRDLPEKKQPKKIKDPHDDMAERLKKAKERREEEERNQKAAEKEAAKKAAEAPEPKPEPKPQPVAPPPLPKPVPKPALVDRRPPMPAAAKKRRTSGRMSTRMRTQRPGRIQVAGPTIPGDLSIEERRPPMLGVKRTHAAPPPEEAPVQVPEAPELPAKAEAIETPPVETPPIEKPQVEAPPVETPPIDRTPPVPEAASKDPSGGPPVNRSLFGGQASSGMDDLFSMGGGQGRLRIRKPSEEPEAEAESGDESED